ncbi:MAG: carboxypeptidase regulatory-like domain-containing protein [Terracidiphilus sp.]
MQACIALAMSISATTGAAQDVEQDPAPLHSAGTLVTVHGVVRNAATGEPLPRALVRIEGDAATGALTDGDGHFEISGLPAGPQIFEVLKPGYQDRPSGAGGVITDDAAGSAHNVIVAADMAELAFSLAPTNAIRGLVTLSTGDPAEGIEVQLLRRTVQEGRGVWQLTNSAKTLSDGGYRFAGLPDGLYAVFTNPTLDSEPATNLVAAGRGSDVVREGYASQFYPDARDLAGAAKIHVANGEDAQANINLTLEPFHAVTATATFPDAGATAPDRAGLNFSAVVLDGQGHALPYGAPYDQATHTIQALLPDGTYSLQLTATGRFLIRIMPGGALRAFTPNTWPYVGSVEFSVAGHAIANLRVPLWVPRPSAVRFTVVHAASSASQTAQDHRGEIVVTASQAGGWLSDGVSTSFAQGMNEGPLDVEYTTPGNYWIHARVAQAGLCEASFTAGGANLAREPLAIALSGATAPLELTARDDCAKLTLTLPPAVASVSIGEEPFFTVYVVPDFDSTTDVDQLTLRPTSGGSVTLEGLTPGSYHVYTFAGPATLEYRNREVLAALPNPGQQINLSPGAASTLTLEAPEH